ncbi:unnamed protein product, partial [Didymodactylos carnosus]
MAQAYFFIFDFYYMRGSNDEQDLLPEAIIFFYPSQQKDQRLLECGELVGLAQFFKHDLFSSVPKTFNFRKTIVTHQHYGRISGAELINVPYQHDLLKGASLVRFHVLQSLNLFSSTQTIDITDTISTVAISSSTEDTTSILSGISNLDNDFVTYDKRRPLENLSESYEDTGFDTDPLESIDFIDDSLSSSSMSSDNQELSMMSKCQSLPLISGVTQSQAQNIPYSSLSRQAYSVSTENEYENEEFYRRSIDQSSDHPFEQWPNQTTQKGYSDESDQKEPSRSRASTIEDICQDDEGEGEGELVQTLTSTPPSANKNFSIRLTEVDPHNNVDKEPVIGREKRRLPSSTAKSFLGSVKDEQHHQRISWTDIPELNIEQGRDEVVLYIQKNSHMYFVGLIQKEKCYEKEACNGKKKEKCDKKQFIEKLWGIVLQTLSELETEIQLKPASVD